MHMGFLSVYLGLQCLLLFFIIINKNSNNNIFYYFIITFIIFFPSRSCTSVVPCYS